MQKIIEEIWTKWISPKNEQILIVYINPRYSAVEHGTQEIKIFKTNR